MGSFIKDFFGGTDDSAQDYTINANKDNQKYNRQMTARARNTLTEFWPQSNDQRNQGYESAYDILMRTIGPQIRALKKGNVQAQNQLLAGLPQMQNAILGNPIDYSAIQSVNLPVDMNFPTTMPRGAALKYPLAGA